MKNLARIVLKRMGLEVKRIAGAQPDAEALYSRGGRIPWSPGYNQAKERFIGQSIADPHLLQLFATQSSLPWQFGVGFDERCVEYPWLLARLSSGSERLLDAGSALNRALILEHPVLEKKTLHILTLAPEGKCFWNKGVSYLFEDLRNVPMRDSSYDTVVCVSTLEHVGCDNTWYTGQQTHQERRSEDFVIATQELARVLKPGGRLFLTVPFGTYRHFGSFQQFDRQLLSRAIAAFGEISTISETFYRYTREGWNLASAEDCASCEYVEWVAKVWSGGGWPNSLSSEPDLAAAARAVACLELTKPALPRSIRMSNSCEGSVP